MPPTGGAGAETAALDRAALLTGLRRQLRAVEDDLRERSENMDRYRAALRGAYDDARAAARTEVTFSAWRDEQVTQIAAAWVLGTVFVRFCEDNGLVVLPFLAGPGNHLAEAEERQAAYLRRYPEKNDRDWLIEAFEQLAGMNRAFADIFDRKSSPLWRLSPSPEAAASLLAFWRVRGPDGELDFDFTDPEELDTGFLEDVYQDLSESARKTYALLATPEFIADLILDLTLEPAVAEFGLTPGFRCIDPVCGSGTFLLGMFRRLLEKWRAVDPKAPPWTHVSRALESVHGCDKNSSAVIIARFRLVIAALRAGGERRLDRVPDLSVNIAVGDSLLDGRGEAPLLDLSEVSGAGVAWIAGDVGKYTRRCDLLARGSYHVVVGEPPYITVRNKAENRAYQELYPTARGLYSLAVPFVERMFELVVRGNASVTHKGGFVGQLTTSSFTKREFGRYLIEEFFPRVELTHVIDTSGVYLPGHRTPTLILIGRNGPDMGKTPIRAVLGIQGEPSSPDDPSQGIVWRSIVEQVNQPGSQSEWVSVRDVNRARFASFPWNLAGGGEAELMESLGQAPGRMREILGSSSVIVDDPGQAEVFALGRPWFARHPDSVRLGRGMVVAETVRDWHAAAQTGALVPYDDEGLPLPLDLGASWGRHLWTMRQTLKAGAGPHQAATRSDDEPWWTWRRRTPERKRGRPAITFASVATHNHFALDPGGTAFGRTAPLITLSDGAGEHDHFAVLGLLNSSIVCFELKQANPGIGGDGPGFGPQWEDWARTYRFTAASFNDLPVPSELPLALGRDLHASGQLLVEHEPAAVCAKRSPPTRARLDAARHTHTRLRQRMVALQEELDWSVYGLYGLLPSAAVSRLTVRPGEQVPEVEPGERAFEIVLARKADAGQAGESWFTRNGSTAITEIPAHWPAGYRAVVRARIDAIASHPGIALVERPEYKRRWSFHRWEVLERDALRAWLVNRCEDRRLWFDSSEGPPLPRLLTLKQLADALDADAGLSSVAALYAGDHLGMPDAPLEDVLTHLLATEHVPYLSALRYEESGLRKRAQWERVWELQHKEDATGQALGIPVPPKYVSRDFRRASYWSQRGRLDIPRERFISYPGTASDDGSPLFGWAGWDHREQAQALAAYCTDHVTTTEGLVPLLAGLLELQPWLNRWHSESAPLYGVPPAAFFAEYRRGLQEEHGISNDALTSWRPSRRRTARRR